RLWDVETGLELRQWQAHLDEVDCVAISPDGRRALSGGRDWAVRLWDLAPREGGGPELAKYTEAVTRDPKDAAAHRQLAWALATGRDPRHRDAKRAIELAQKAVELAPAEGRFWTTLGVARYRAGDWAAAVEALDKARQLGKEEDGVASYFLAMAH